MSPLVAAWLCFWPIPHNGRGAIVWSEHRDADRLWEHRIIDVSDPESVALGGRAWPEDSDFVAGYGDRMAWSGFGLVVDRFDF